jgi:hypothetical protein
MVSRELGIGITGNISKCDGEQLIDYFGLEIVQWHRPIKIVPTLLRN